MLTLSISFDVFVVRLSSDQSPARLSAQALQLFTVKSHFISKMVLLGLLAY